MSVFYLETGSTDPCYNLAFEQYVLEHRTEGDWLMLWQNANAVIIGRNQNTAEEINPAFIQEHGIAVVRRMTGGGAVYHDLGNLNYSFITDAGDAALQNLSRFTQPVCRALRRSPPAGTTSWWTGRKFPVWPSGCIRGGSFTTAPCCLTPTGT